jgi:hypothetical protein
MSTIAIDFDGVLSDYSGKFSPRLDPPVDGAIAAIKDYQDAGLEVCIYTTRADGPEAIIRLEAWLIEHGLPSRRVKQILITGRKPPAVVYLDDRAWRFTGIFPSPEEIKNFRTWQGH